MRILVMEQPPASNKFLLFLAHFVIGGTRECPIYFAQTLFIFRT